MVAPDRSRMPYREASELLDYRFGQPAGGAAAFGRLIHILWFMTVGKRRFVPTGPDPKLVRKRKKLDRQNRRRHHNHHGH